LINAFQVAFLFYLFIIDTAHFEVWQYGYHTSALNQLQAVLTCKIPPPHTSCIPMSDVTFSFVSSIFTVGGLAGSLFANLIMDKWGRRGAHRICAFLIALGSAFMGLSNSVFFLLVGR
jgi:CCR4-NOT transcription complex subunit 1